MFLVDLVVFAAFDVFVAVLAVAVLAVAVLAVAVAVVFVLVGFIVLVELVALLGGGIKCERGICRKYSINTCDVSL